jgi:hypothetical protein
MRQVHRRSRVRLLRDLNEASCAGQNRFVGIAEAIAPALAQGQTLTSVSGQPDSRSLIWFRLIGTVGSVG